MGQPVTFLRTVSPSPGVVRFELNRTLTGMGHERYRATDEIIGDRPCDELARRMLATGRVASLHIYGSVITAELADSEDSEASANSDLSDDLGLGEVIASLYTHYVPGVEIPSDEELIAMVEA